MTPNRSQIPAQSYAVVTTATPLYEAHQETVARAGAAPRIIAPHRDLTVTTEIPTSGSHIEHANARGEWTVSGPYLFGS